MIEKMIGKVLQPTATKKGCGILDRAHEFRLVRQVRMQEMDLGQDLPTAGTPLKTIRIFPVISKIYNRPNLHEAVRISVVLYLIPYLFVYHPALILEAPALQILISVSTYILGVIAAASAMQNYLIVKNRLHERAMIALACIGLLYPLKIFSLFGFALFFTVIILQRLRKPFRKLDNNKRR